MKTIINENQRGFLFNNGKYVRLLEPGRHYTFKGQEIEIADISRPVAPQLCSLDTILRDEKAASQIAIAEAADEQLALHFVNGKFAECLKRGKYAFWSIYDKHEFTMVDISSPEAEGVPEYIFSKIPGFWFHKVEVAEYQKACLYFNQKLVRLLDAGTYYFWKGSTKVEAKLVDTRLTQVCITGQEIMSQDKVSLRITLVCNYRITDYVRVLSEIDDYKEQIHVAAQLALREYISRYRIDEILENKGQISAYVLEKLKEKEQGLYVEILDAGVKDIILPGEIREIMNTVLIAEKKAQANVITRREEVASTRSLLNTAKLMDENKTLYKLKELEYLERVSGNVGNINVTGTGDILSQLAAAIKGA